MKNKILYMGTALAMLLCALVFLALGERTDVLRFHQHLEQPGEAELGACTVCEGKGGLCTHLPVIRIDTNGQKIPGAAILDKNLLVLAYETGPNGEEEIQANISTIEEENVWHHADDPATHSSSALIRYRGNTSRSFSKHSYSIKLIEQGEPELNRDLPLMGMNADSEWSLHGPFLDKTLLRNYMWMNISAEVMGYAPNVRLCELVLDGEYQGVYVLMETIREGEGRVDLTDYEPGDPICSYIVRIGSNLDPLKTIENFTYYTYRLDESKEMEVIYPGTMHQTQDVHDYICTDLSQAEYLLYSAQMNDGSRAYRDVLDVDSFVNYYILQEFLAVNDAFSESTYFYRDVRGKIHVGPVWDYNNVLDNFPRPVPMDELILAQRGWYGQLMTDKDFVERIIHRYNQLRQGVLSDEYLNTYLDETVAWLGSAVKRNYTVWGYSFDPQQLSRVEYRQPTISDVLKITRAYPEQNEQILNEWILKLNPADYDQAIQWMRESMLERGAWLDQNIDSLRQYCSDSKNATRILG